MKRKLFFSILLGFIFLTLSLLYKSGSSNMEPMPYLGGGCNIGGSCGVAMGVVAMPPGGFTTPTSLAKRGLPLPVVSVNTDDDNPSNYYKNLILVNLTIDWAFYSLVAFGVFRLSAKLPAKIKS